MIFAAADVMTDFPGATGETVFQNLFTIIYKGVEPTEIAPQMIF